MVDARFHCGSYIPGCFLDLQLPRIEASGNVDVVDHKGFISSRLPDVKLTGRSIAGIHAAWGRGIVIVNDMVSLFWREAPLLISSSSYTLSGKLEAAIHIE